MKLDEFSVHRFSSFLLSFIIKFFPQGLKEIAEKYFETCVDIWSLLINEGLINITHITEAIPFMIRHNCTDISSIHSSINYSTAIMQIDDSHFELLKILRMDVYIRMY